MRRLSTFLLTVPLFMATAMPAVAQSPTPTEDLLSGMVTEEVEPGVLRVINDGVRDLTSVEAVDIVAGYDDGIWLLREDEFLRLGSDGSHEWPTGSQSEDRAFEVAPDGTMWVIPSPSYGGSDAYRGDGLRSTEGEDWTVHPCPGTCRGGMVTPDGTVWASWREERDRWRVGHLGPAGWQPLDGYARNILHPYAGYHRLFLTDAGIFFGEMDATLFRYEDGDWVAFSSGGRLVDVAPDGTAWLGDAIDDDGGVGLARFADGKWARWTPADLPDIRFPFGLDYEFEVAPDGSLWFDPWRSADDEPPEDDSFSAVADVRLVCDGLAHFGGKTLDRFLPGECISMDIAADGSVWVLAGGEKVWVSDAEDGDWTLADDGEGRRDLYVITPEAVAAAE